MRRGQGGRPPIPTHEEWQKVVLIESEVVACSGRLDGALGAMCMALNNGMTATVCVDVSAPQPSSRHSRRCFPAAIHRLAAAVPSGRSWKMAS